ncbi:hypothetical protein ACQKOH_02650 [Sphingomonas sp. NPDC092331]|jgi:hypothetical protein|uniref:hypothetical protein n=1 Tax=unclassified Sphingomonas TaxID=196159 RepID=UPI0031F495B9
MMGLTWLVSIVTGAILQAGLTRATVMHLSGETPQFGQLLAVGISMILPMIAIGLLAGVGVIIGFMLLIVPGSSCGWYGRWSRRPMSRRRSGSSMRSAAARR